MKLTKPEAVKLINQHKDFYAFSFNPLSNKKDLSKQIESLLKKTFTLILMN